MLWGVAGELICVLRSIALAAKASASRSNASPGSPICSLAWTFGASELLRCALENKRSLSKEIGIRLRNSFTPPQAPPVTSTYPAHTSQGPLIADDRTPGAAPLNDHDRALLTVFRQLSPEKQLSLLTLLKP